MDVVAFIFPLLSLKPEIVSFIIQCMDEIDIVTFSLISRGTKNLVESIGFTATDVTLYEQGCLFLILTFRTRTINFILVEWNDEWREGIDDQYDMTVTDIVTVEPDDDPEMVDYEMSNFQLKDWIGHLMSIFHIRFIDFFDFESSDCRFTFDSISREFNRNSVKHLIVPSSGNQAYGQQLIDFFQATRITISSTYFAEKILLHRVLIQNLDLVCFNGGGDLTLDDLLITNSKAICIYQGQTMTMKMINRFIKLWQPGSNPRLECFVIHLDEVWLPQDLFKGITYTEMNDEIEVEFDKREEYGLLDSNGGAEIDERPYVSINIRAKNSREAKVLASIRMGNDEDEEEVRSYLVNKCKMVGASPEDFHRELRLLENEEPEKSFMILARTVKEIDAINTWRVENSPKTVVLPAMEISSLQSISGYKLKLMECQDHNLKMEGLANEFMARLL